MANKRETELKAELKDIADSLASVDANALLYLDLYYIAQRVTDIKQELRLERAKRL